MTEPFRFLSSALISGSVASIVSAAALAAFARVEGKAAAQPLNATSHWWHGDRAAAERNVDLPHTGVGYATHHASSILWAFLFEALRSRNRAADPVSIARDAAIVSATAAVVDYGLIPRRLTPGWELALPKRSVAVGLLALAAGLTVGGLITRQINMRAENRERRNPEGEPYADQSHPIRQGAR
jgi:hypothetical protein